VELPDEPKGWRILQAKAQQEKDPAKLASIIDQMNRLLDQHERMGATGDSLVRNSAAPVPSNPPKLDTELCQV
jgi:hypothetical protein